MILNKSNYNKLFEKWLLASIILILIMVIVGGLTRITESGLSITNWELFKGVFPPVTRNQWDEYFALYKLIPQHSRLHADGYFDYYIDCLLELREFIK